MHELRRTELGQDAALSAQSLSRAGVPDRTAAAESRADYQLIDLPPALTRRLFDNPQLQALLTAPTLAGYFAPALQWNPSPQHFPCKERLLDLMSGECERLYGGDAAGGLRAQLEASFAAETGASLYLPRRFVGYRSWQLMGGIAESGRLCASGMRAPSPYPDLFQGQTAWAAANAERGHLFSVSLSSGSPRISNVVSGAYLDLPFFERPLRLLSRRFDDTPHALAPGVSQERLDTLMGRAANLCRRDPYAYGLCMHIGWGLDRNRESFADQIAVTHSALMNAVYPQDLGGVPIVRQLTFAAHRLAAQLLCEVLVDPGTVTHTIFSDPALRRAFMQNLFDANAEYRSPYATSDAFDRVVSSRDVKVLRRDPGLMQAPLRELVGRLEHGELFPSELLTRFVLLVEAGLCPVSDLAGAHLNQGLKTASCEFLERHFPGESARWEALAELPVHLAASEARWGVVREADAYRRLDFHDLLPPKEGLLPDHLSGIAATHGVAALLTAELTESETGAWAEEILHGVLFADESARRRGCA